MDYTQPFIARRAFKAGGVFYPMGTVIEDVTTVRLFKSRINEDLLMPLPDDENGLEALREFLWERSRLDLDEILSARASKGSDVAEEENPDASEPPTPGTQEDPEPEVEETPVEEPEVVIPANKTFEIPKVTPATTPPVKPAAKTTPPAPKK